MIRKLRQVLKPVVWVMTISFLLSMASMAISMRKPQAELAFEINGIKVKELDVMRSMEQAISRNRGNDSNKTDENAIEFDVFNSIVQEKVLLSEAKKLSIKVPRSEVTEKFKKDTTGIEIQQLEKYLEYQRLTIKSYKKMLKNELIAKKVRDAILDEYKPTEEELKTYYDDNKFNTYKGKEYNEVKTELEETVKNSNKYAYYDFKVGSLLDAAKITNKSARYIKYFKNDAIDFGIYKVSNVDFYKKYSYSLLYGGAKDKKEGYQKTIDQLKKEVSYALEAKERKLEIPRSNELSEAGKVAKAYNVLLRDIKSKYKYTDKDLKAYFDKNTDKYDTKESVNFKLIALNNKASEADMAVSKKKAEEILAKAKEEGADFAALAKEFSQGPSAPKGGELGSFGKGRMVPEFDAAVFAGKTGVLDQVIKTQFGYHIINVKELTNDAAGEAQATASHILIKEEASEETKTAIKTKAEGILKEITEGKEIDVAVEEYTDLNKKDEFGPIYKDGYIPEIGSNKDLLNVIFTMKAEAIKLITVESGSYIVKLTKYVPFKKATLEAVKENVIFDFLKEKGSEEMKKIADKATSVEYKVLDEEISTVLNKVEEETTEE